MRCERGGIRAWRAWGLAAGLVAAWAARAAGGASMALVRSPYLQAGAPDSMTVCWALAEPAACALEYGTTRAYGRAVPSQTPTGHPRSASHFCRIEGLEPGTRYFYRILCEGENLTASDPDLSFTTHLAEASRPWSFFVLGDSGTGSADQLRIAALLEHLKPRPDFGLHTGDVTQRSGCDDREYDWCFFSVYGDVLSRIPVYPTRGNHDAPFYLPWPLDPLRPRWRVQDPTRPEHATWQFAFYQVFRPHGGNGYGTPSPSTFEYANARFVCADIATLRRDLQDYARVAFAESTKTWHFFYGHWSVGELFDRVTRSSRLPRIDFTLEGHRHYYRRPAPRGAHGTISVLIGNSGADCKTSYLAAEVTEQNPHGLTERIRWAEKSPHLVHFIVEGSHLTMKVYYPDGIVADWVEVTARDGGKDFREMPLGEHPRRPLWQRALTPLQRRLWVVENPKWTVTAQDRKGRVQADRYVGAGPLMRLSLDAPIPEPPPARPLAAFYPSQPARERALADLAEFGWALRELASMRYRIASPGVPRNQPSYFDVRFRELMGGTSEEQLMTWLTRAARDASLPVRERLAAVVALGVVRTDAAVQTLAEFARCDDVDIRFGAAMVLATECADARGLLSIAQWLKAHGSAPRFAEEVTTLCEMSLPRFFIPCPQGRRPAEWADFLASEAERLVYDARRRCWRLRASPRDGRSESP